MRAGDTSGILDPPMSKAYYFLLMMTYSHTCTDHLRSYTHVRSEGYHGLRNR